MPLRLPARPLLYRRTLILLVHIALIPLAYLAAFGLRFDFQIPPQEFGHFQTTVWYLLGIRLIVFWAGGLYRGYWKHVGLRDLVDLGLAVTISSAAFVAALSLLGLLRGMPRSVFLLDWVVMIFFSGGIRFAARALRESRLARARLDDGRRTIIIGAGEGGEQLLRQALHDPRAGMNVVGFVDDKPETHGRTLHGVPVLGHTGRLKELAAKYAIELLVIAMRSVTGAQTRRIVDRCRETGVEFKIIPSIDDLLKKRATIDQVRDVAIEDLLGRDPVHLNLEQIKQDLAGKSILVTGGAGSIGSVLARQIASYGPARFVLISTDKAVNPTSVLGATKRIGERIVLELPSLCEAATDFRAVRFGNVLCSDGSVVPLFKRQISAGGPVKVTHPDVTRYFMTIPESVGLVLEAAALPEAARRISILEMGKPIRILELAEQLIRLSGLEPYRDISIAFSGLRPGEKLAEELVACAEDTVATSDDKIRVIERNGADGPAVERDLEHLLEVLAHGSRDELIDAISRLVPEYVPWQTRERPLLVPARPRATPDPRSPLRPAYAHTAGPDGAPESATA